MDISPKKEAMTAETLAFSHSFSHVIQLTSHPFSCWTPFFVRRGKKNKIKKGYSPGTRQSQDLRGARRF
jgi:hypothetical protein